MLKTIPFLGSVRAKKDTVLVSEELRFPYTVKSARIDFPRDVQRMLRIKIFVSFDDTVPEEGEPRGYNIVKYGNVNYVVGDSGPVVFNLGVPVRRASTWIKIYAKNLDSFDHTVDVKVDINVEHKYLEGIC